jgi:hypothetical protein
VDLEPVIPYTPHLSYYWQLGIVSTLYHHTFSGTNWLISAKEEEAIEPPRSRVGKASSLALEDVYPYQARIAYYDHFRGDLKYAWQSSTTWNVITLDSTGNIGAFPSLALDSSGYPHISYLDVRQTGSTLKYRWKTQDGWFSQTVDTVGDLPYSTGRSSLELDQADRAHISYYDGTNGDLKYARFDGAVWIIQTIETEGDVGTRTSLELDQASCPHISYRDVTNQALKYAFVLSVKSTFLPIVLNQYQ